MAADNDNRGLNDEDLNPEFTGGGEPVEHTPLDEDAPLKGFDLELDEEVPEGSSGLKKGLTWLGLIAASVAVGFYLMHQQKAKVAAQSDVAEATKTSLATIAESKPSEITPVSAPENSPKDLAKSLDSSVEADNVKPAVTTSQDTAKQLEDNAANMVKAAEQNTPPPVQAIPAVTIETAVTSEKDEQIEALKGQVSESEQKIKNLSVRVKELDSTLSALSQSFVRLEKKRVSHSATPAKKVKAIHADKKKRSSKVLTKKDVNALLAKAPKKKAPVNNVSKAYYSVKAVVPGRAWIEMPTGNTFSVTVGDRVLGFGVVSEINSQYGEVLFDGGDVIKYGSDDH